VAYNWPTGSERYQRVNRFVQAFFAHLKDIKARRPRWQDFDVSASVAGWTRFPAAEQWLRKAELFPESDRVTVQARVPLDPKERDAVFQEFADYLRAPKPEKAAIHLEPLQREALFREFADYLRTPRRQNAAVYLEPGQREALFQQFAEYQKRQYLMIASRYPAADH